MSEEDTTLICVIIILLCTIIIGCTVVEINGNDNEVAVSEKGKLNSIVEHDFMTTKTDELDDENDDE